MRQLKDEFRENIKKSALESFYKIGYEKTSMRLIADKSGMTVGNLYRYFPNKEGLFKILMDPVRDEILTFMNSEHNGDYRIFYNGVPERLTNFLIDIFKKYEREIYILINNSENSPYYGMKRDIIDLLIEHILKECPGYTDSFMAETISKSYIDGIVTIFNRFRDDDKRDSYINKLHEFCFLSIIK